MIFEALQTTLIGMGCVFAFLLLLMGAMHILRILVEKTTNPHIEKIAVAIAAAHAQED